MAAIIEGIIRSIPETTSDVMESTAAARRSYAAALPAHDQPAPRDFDESRSHAVQRCTPTSTLLPHPTTPTLLPHLLVCSPGSKC